MIDNHQTVLHESVSASASPRVGYAVVDVETTGYYAGEDEIVEIAVVTLDIHREPIQAWHSLVNPGRPIPAGATAVHRITDHDVAAAPTMAELAGPLWRLLGGRVIVAHKSEFDCGFLDAALPHPGISWWDASICTLRGAQGQLGRRAGTKLGACCAEFAVPYSAELAHSALADALACTGLFRRLRLPAGEELLAASGRHRRGLPIKAAHPRVLPGITNADGHVGAWELVELTRLGPAALPPWPTNVETISTAGPTWSNAGAPWTAEAEAALRADWLAGAGSSADILLAELCRRYERSTKAVVSRLLKLLCHPQNPGQSVTEAQATKLGYELREPQRVTAASGFEPPF